MRHYPPSGPKRPPPDHGIRVKKMGSTWWGQRWILALESINQSYLSRLGRGRTYARAGRVHDLEIGTGVVTARVTGSRPKPYAVTIRLEPLDDEQWRRALENMIKSASFRAQLLGGEMPKEIDEAFAPSSLFPRKELETECSCPDWANPCKHVAATHYVLGEAFDKDPFLLFELRGRGKEAVLQSLRGHARRDAQPRGVVPKGDLDALRAPIREIHVTIEAPTARTLELPPSWKEPDALTPIYAAASELARSIATTASPLSASEAAEEEAEAEA